MAGHRARPHPLTRHARALKLAGLVAAVYAAFFFGYLATRRWGAVRLDAERAEVPRYEFARIALRSRDPALRRAWRATPPRARVLRGGRAVTTIAGLREVPLAWDPGKAAFVGRWPCPWNAPEGDYDLELVGGEALGPRLRQGRFRVVRRAPRPLPPRFAAVSWESVRPLESLRVRGPDGKEGDWTGLLDWAQYVGADAFWMLGGQTPGLAPGQVWVETNLGMVPKVAAECRRRGLKFGVYAMCYLTQSKERLPRYEYALDIEDGEVKVTRAVSLRDPERPKDLAALLKRWRDLPGVDFLGLDYIRNALGGYELAEDFYAEMPGVAPPPGWESWSPRDRMLFFARKKIMRKDPAFIDAWQWWRAHRVSLVISGLRQELGWEKPLWAFTLTWDKGWHHGQDPAMFTDAGVDSNALMLYEANAAQFDWMLADWRGYLARADAQLIVGDVVDWPLHQNSPRGPGEMGYRLKAAIRGVHRDGLAAGLFVHDLERALHGRLGPYSTRDWMDEARRVVRYFKALPS